MTEQEWRTCSHSRDMLRYLWSRQECRTKANRRKLRLVGCACARRIWRLLDDQLREAVVLAERFADRQVDSKARQDAHKRTWDAMLRRQQSSNPWEGYEFRTAVSVLAERAIEAAFRACNEEEWAYAWSEQPHSSHPRGGVSEQQEQAAKNERQAQADLLRDVFASLTFQPIAVDQSWLSKNAICLAQAIYDDRAFDRMPILADALEEAGCTNVEILGHCRGAGPHVRGCWVVDLLLGKG